MDKYLVNDLKEDIKKYLYSLYAKGIENARKEELYTCICRCLLEKIGKNWYFSKIQQSDKTVYILSFEYLPGKFLEINAKRLGIFEELKSSLKEMDISFSEILKVEKEPALGNGDLGTGSSFIHQMLTNRNINTIAYGLRYENGDMEQKILNGKQVSFANDWLSDGNVWEHKKAFNYYINFKDYMVKSKVHDYPIVSEDGKFVNTLRLFESAPQNPVDFEYFSSGNIQKAFSKYINDKSITQFLYPDDSTENGKKLRFRQEYFYAVSVVEDILRRFLKKEKNIEKLSDEVRIIVNDVHPALTIIYLIEKLTSVYNLSMKKAFNICKKIFNFIEYSVLDSKNECISLDIIKSENKKFFHSILKIDEFIIKNNYGDSIIKNNSVILENVLINFSSNVSFFSKDIITNYKNSTFNFINLNIDITKFLKISNSKTFNFIKNYTGIDILEYEESKKLSDFIDDESFLKELDRFKLANKFKLSEEIKEKRGLTINPYSIFEMQFSTIHEINRQLLNAFKIANLYYKLKDNSNIYIAPITFFIGGKASNGYFMAKEIIKFVIALSNMINKDKYIKEKIKLVFVENYNVSTSQKFISAVDVFDSYVVKKYNNHNFELLKSAYNFSNIVSTCGGILNNFEINNSIYNIDIDEDNLDDYDAVKYYYKNEELKNTIDHLINEPYSNFPYEFKIIFDQIIKYNDSFLIFKSLNKSMEAEFKVNNDFMNEIKWNKNKINNFLWANEFNFEHNFNYIGKIWKIE
ncbi:MAG: glycogen/starch/alpha-glucan phosphorylase [Peptoniphilaceae bacterium]|nr:glycogen/starch/alpha-glucan phosphorylase [Peptoniphilaceae bacterium]MDD7383538.1 glycogen/starch/alpha-glucan phosphorylase [Peptoniphilaceae bacterium]MDY3738711.1 glycogen/starch/alpha-glucan phosphorylase [Peptoniphilaceae bacterium]